MSISAFAQIGRGVVGLMAAGMAFLAHAPASRADLNLYKLECVNPRVVLTVERAFAVTEEDLQDALLGKLRAKLPNLRVDATCANGLYFRVVMAKSATEGGRVLGYFGGVRLELLRTAIVLDTMARTEFTAWHGAATLIGPPGDERTALANSLDGLLGGFAGAYYQAGNP